MRASFLSLRRLWIRRVGWLVLLWTVSVVVMAVVAGIFRLLMKLAGMMP